jgi:hypothetical protein
VRLSLSGLNERLTTTLEIVAGVIAKKIVEHAGPKTLLMKPRCSAI